MWKKDEIEHDLAIEHKVYIYVYKVFFFFSFFFLTICYFNLIL